MGTGGWQASSLALHILHCSDLLAIPTSHANPCLLLDACANTTSIACTHMLIPRTHAHTHARRPRRRARIPRSDYGVVLAHVAAWKTLVVSAVHLPWTHARRPMLCWLCWLCYTVRCAGKCA